jgi:hypothetical protein
MSLVKDISKARCQDLLKCLPSQRARALVSMRKILPIRLTSCTAPDPTKIAHT